MSDLGTELRTAAREDPDRAFLVGEGEPVTFADLDGRADRCASGLAVRGCRERLADYKVRRRFEIRAELPTTPAGQIAKARLRREVVPA